MNTRSILSFLQKTVVTAGASMICGTIGAIEGAISGVTGAFILGATGYAGHSITETAIASSAGVGALGVVEGVILGALAVNGFFGTAKDMEKNGYKNINKRILGYFGYTANQILGGITAGLLLMMVNSTMPFGEIVADVAVGASITGLIITPIVTALTVAILAAAFAMTKSEETLLPTQMRI